MIEIWRQNMAASITWLIPFQKMWLRVVSAMTGNPPLASKELDFKDKG